MGSEAKFGDGGLLSIGVVADSFGVSQNTIRRIEAAGLMRPAVIVSGSGYRYYDSDNISVLSEILALKAFGFTQEDIREYLTHPGDYLTLFDKLIRKQSALDLLVERFERRIKSKALGRCELLEYAGTDCVSKAGEMRLTPETLSSFSKRFLFETIRSRVQIDFTRPILILTECEDYRTFRPDLVQKIRFCIPLAAGAEGKGAGVIPPSRAVSAAWNIAQQDYSALLPQIDAQFALNGLRQSDTLRIAYDIGGYMGDNIALDDMLGHILVPI